MALETHPVWPFGPNWTDSVTETLEWMTDVLQSPTGSEQRRSLRFFPRRTLDFTVAAEGAECSLLDNLLLAYGAMDWYLPIWYNVTISSAPSTTTFIPCAPTPAIKAGSAIFIAGETPYDYQVAEVASVSNTGITLVAPISIVASQSAIHPMTTARLIEQPVVTAMHDSLVTADPQFLITEPPSDYGVTSAAAGLTDIYRDFYVITRQPDWADGIERGIDRLIDEFDNNVNAPERVDTASRPFPTQKFRWVLDTTDEHSTFYALAQVLRGRATPVWVPTWMDDMRLVSPVAAISSTLVVSRNGFTMAGGVRPERQDIMIELMDGRRFYRRITGSAASATTETIAIDSPIGEAISPASVLRVCFIMLMRLDHDSIEIEHLTDDIGVSEVEVTFRSAPNSRQPLAAFGDA